MNRALLVGINEYRQQPLAGCIPDVEDLATYLVGERGYDHDSIVPLHDSRASKAAILHALSELLSASAPGDHVLFHFSGHGTLTPAPDPETLEEVLCPFDFDWTPETAICERQLRAVLNTVPAGVALTMVIDACHSGELERLLPRESDRGRFLRAPSDVLWRLASRRRIVRHFRSLSQHNVAVVSACSAAETAPDTRFSGWANGAFTHHWLRELGRAHNRSATLTELVALVSRPLGYYQMHPVVSGPREILHAPFLAAGLFDREVTPIRSCSGGGGGGGKTQMQAGAGISLSV